MPKNKKQNSSKWLLLGICAAIIASPNAAMSKYALNSLDPLTFSMIRFGAVALLSLPIILYSLPNFNKRNLKYITIAGLYMAVAVFSYLWALELGQANYVTILSLASPIVLVIVSVKITKEKVKQTSITSISLAALGAFIIIFAPQIQSNSESEPLLLGSAILMMFNIITFPLAIVYAKKATTSGLPVASAVGITSTITLLLSVVLYVLIRPEPIQTIDNGTLLASLYTGIFVVFLARMLDILSYKHLGSAALSTLFYLETFAAILFTSIILGEKLTWSLFVGGAIILLSIWLTQGFRHSHFAHLHLMKRH